MKKMIIDSYIMMTENNFTIWGGASTLGIKCTWCQSRLHSAFLTMPSFANHSCLERLWYILSRLFSYFAVSLARFSSSHSLTQHISQGSISGVHLQVSLSNLSGLQRLQLSTACRQLPNLFLGPKSQSWERFG